MVLGVAFFALNVYASTDHAFWRHYSLAFILTTALLPIVAGIVAVPARRSADPAVRRS
jgi:hypothetical protein